MNKVSINKWESMRTDNTVVAQFEGLDGVVVKIKRTLSMMEMLQLVEDVVSTVLPGDGRYLPELQDFAIKSAVLANYAGFHMPQNVEKQYDLIYNTGAAKQVLFYIDIEQYHEILNAIEKRVAHEVRTLESLSGLKATEIIDRVGALTDQFESVFSGIDKDTLNETLSQIKTIGSMDERTLAHALIMEKDGGESGYRDDALPVTVSRAEDGGKVIELPRR